MPKYSKTILRNPYLVGSFACIGGGLFGLDISSMSGILTNPHFRRQFGNPNPDEEGGIVASMPAGSLVGALAVGKLADILGRKRTIQLSGILWVIGATLQCAAVNRGMLVVGRIIAGMSVGMASATVPLYQAEITAPNIRGRMVSLQQWSITWGILLQYFVQFGCSEIDGVASFRIPWGVQMIPAIVLSVGMVWFPESPRWLIDHGREDEAFEILTEVHGKGDPNHELVQLEFAEIKNQVHLEKTEGAKSYKDLLNKDVLRRVSLGMSLQAWSQLTGMNVMMYYVTYVFRAAGQTGRRANLVASSINYVLNVAATVPAIIYIDKWGRRPMLIIGLAAMSFWLFLVGGLQSRFGQVGEIDGESQWVVLNNKPATDAIIAASYLFVCSFAITMGPVSWTYPSEIFPMRVRAKAVSLSTASNWIMNCVLAYAVPPALDKIYYKTYFIFATFNAAGCIHVIFMFPETAGRTLEEVEEIFNQGHVFAAWKIKRDVGKKSLAEVKHTEGSSDAKESVNEKEHV